MSFAYGFREACLRTLGKAGFFVTKSGGRGMGSLNSTECDESASSASEQADQRADFESLSVFLRYFLWLSSCVRLS